MHKRTRITAAALMGLALAGCTTPPVPPSPPFQPRASGDAAAYGYSDARLDPAHYSVAYADTTARTADSFLELRAAQIAQGAGMHYFAFDKRGNTALRRTENSMEMPDDRLNRRGGGGSPLSKDWIPDSTPVRNTTYYLAWGQIALLTDSQGRDNPKALGVSEVLARPGATAAP